MYDLTVLQSGHEINKVIPVACAEVPEGQEKPTITICISQKDLIIYEEALRVEQRVYNDGKQRIFRDTDNRRFCNAMSYVVKDSSGLFGKNGNPEPHSQEGIRLLVNKVKPFADWLSDEIAYAFKELKAHYEGATIKN